MKQGRGRTLIDSYHCDLLADGISVKVRHTESPGVFLKIRTAVHPRIAIGDVEGAPETWLRVRAHPPLSDAEGDWLDVRKRIVKRNGIEVAHIELGDEVWWSLALRVRGSRLPRLPREIATHLRRHSAAAISCSYPILLLGERHAGRRGERVPQPAREVWPFGPGTGGSGSGSLRPGRIRPSS
jgi:hypothetical protein